MKQLVILSIALSSLLACTEQKQENTQKEAFIKTISAAEFKNGVDAGNGIILDVRTPEEVAEGHIANASTINFYDEDFEKKINLIAKDKAIYVYCKSGGRSSQAAALLQKNGFNSIYELENGITAWEALNYPLLQTTSQKDEHIREMSLDEFEALLKENELVLIDFHTVWCAPCRKMAPVIDKIESSYLNKALVMRIDVDKSKAIAEAYKIEGVPVFILFKNGKVLWKQTGIVGDDVLRAQIDRNL